MASRPGDDFGMFLISRNGVRLQIIFGNGEGWEHASAVAIDRAGERTPTWDEMCFVKDLFWEKDECAIQYHPTEKNYVNNHPHCLHVWRPTHGHIPQPPVWMIGFKQ